jgi:hypothetical protein
MRKHGLTEKNSPVIALRRQTDYQFSPKATRKNKRIEFRVKVRASN